MVLDGAQIESGYSIDLPIRSFPGLYFLLAHPIFIHSLTLFISSQTLATSPTYISTMKSLSLVSLATLAVGSSASALKVRNISNNNCGMHHNFSLIPPY